MDEDGELIWRIPGPIPAVCPFCEKPDDGTIEIYPQRTAYSEAYENVVTCCSACKKINDEFWDEQWDEYYRGLL